MVGKSAHLLRQLPITMSELRRSEVLQSGVQRPASKSSSARFPTAFNRPAAMSASICRSHCSAANSSNHFAETGQLRLGQVRNSRFEILDAHGEKLSTEPWIANLPCMARALTPTKSLSGMNNHTECMQPSKSTSSRGKRPLLGN